MLRDQSTQLQIDILNTVRHEKEHHSTQVQAQHQSCQKLLQTREVAATRRECIEMKRSLAVQARQGYQGIDRCLVWLSYDRAAPTEHAATQMGLHQPSTLPHRRGRHGAQGRNLKPGPGPASTHEHLISEMSVHKSPLPLQQVDSNSSSPSAHDHL